MTEKELSDVLAKGESRTVEFKKSTADITKDIYETVCSFSNRDGGYIFLVHHRCCLHIVPESL